MNRIPGIAARRKTSRGHHRAGVLDDLSTQEIHGRCGLEGREIHLPTLRGTHPRAPHRDALVAQHDVRSAPWNAAGASTVRHKAAPRPPPTYRTTPPARRRDSSRVAYRTTHPRSCASPAPARNGNGRPERPDPCRKLENDVWLFPLSFRPPALGPHPRVAPVPPVWARGAPALSSCRAWARAACASPSSEGWGNCFGVGSFEHQPSQWPRSGAGAQEFE